MQPESTRPQSRRWNRPLLALSAALSAALALSACSAHKQAGAVAVSQREALSLLAAAHTADLAAVHALTDALLCIEREALRTRLVRAVAQRYIAVDGQADLAQLDADIDAGVDEAAPAWSLAADVQAGALTREAARSVVSGVAAALSGPAAARRAALSTALAPLPALRAHREEADALRAALEARGAAITRLYMEVGADADALDALRGASPDPRRTLQTLAAELWKRAVLERLEDPERKAAAQRALDRLLDLAPELEAGARAS